MGDIDAGDLGCAAWGLTLFAGLLAMYVAGLRLRRLLPASHSDELARVNTHAVIGLLVTLIGIVLGMMVSSAKTQFDGVGQTVSRYAIEIAELDHLLHEYGDAGDETRGKLRLFTQSLVARFDDRQEETTVRAALLNTIEANIRSLKSEQRLLRVQNDAVARFDELTRSRNELLAAANLPPSKPFFVVVALWAAFTFLVLGLVSSWSVVVFIAVGCAAFGVSSAVFVLLDMSTPLSGIISISIDPLRNSWAALRL